MDCQENLVSSSVFILHAMAVFKLPPVMHLSLGTFHGDGTDEIKIGGR